MTLLSIVQPYVPVYRVPFFDALNEVLNREGIELQVLAAEPAGAQAARGDAAGPLPWVRPVDPTFLSVAHRRLQLTSSLSDWRDSDAVIVPLMGTSPDALIAGLSGRRKRFGLWGHVAPYTAPPNALDLAVERWLMRRSSRIFAYTPGGANFARAAGIPASKITVVMNTIDTAGVRGDRHDTGLDEPDELFGPESSFGTAPYVAYIGGLDSEKRVDTLAEAMQLLHERGSGLKFVIGGSGVARDLLRPAEQRGQAVYLGFVTPAQKARILRGAAAIANPGRVGLIAVDSLAAKVPIVSTRSAFHAPEHEYLREGDSWFLSEPDPMSFADALEKVALAGPRRSELDWHAPQLDEMVANFAEGVMQLLERSTL